MPKFRETVLEIDLNAVTHNFNVIKSKLKPETKVLAVVKAFAYGSDAQEIAKHLETLNIDYFAVAYVYEGIVLRNAGITTPILVLHAQPINFKDIISYNLEPSIYSKRILNEFLAVAEESQVSNYPIHIKFNTGLNRLGFKVSETSAIAETLQATNSLKVRAIFSHLAASEDKNEKAFTTKQINAFKEAAFKLREGINDEPFLHLCNTSGILNFPEAHFDMVRTGIGLYGFGNDVTYNSKFQPISTLKTCISQILRLKKGDSLGYNRAFLQKKKPQQQHYLLVMPMALTDN